MIEQPRPSARLTSLPFLLVWMFGHVLSWGLVLGFGDIRALYWLPDLPAYVLIGLLMGGALGLVQKGLARFALGLPLRGWLRVSLVGWVLGWLAYMGLSDVILGFWGMPIWLQALPIFVIPGLLQWWILRRHVQRAAWWLAASAVSALTFGAMWDGSTTASGLGVYIAGAAAQGAVTGLVLLWLVGMTGLVPQPQRDVSRLTVPDDVDVVHDDLYYEDEADYQTGHFTQG